MLKLQRFVARAQWSTMQAAAKTKVAFRKPFHAAKRLKPRSAGLFTTGNARLALELTGKLGSSVPFLQGVTEAISKIMEHVDAVKRNRKECAELAELCQTFTAALVTATGRMNEEDMDDNLKLHIAEFERRLQGIEKTMHAMRKPSLIKRLFKRDEHEAALKEYKEGLKTALMLFQVKETVAVHGSVTRVDRCLKEVSGGFFFV